MQCLKKVWNSWMNLDEGKWLEYIPPKILIILLGAGYLLFTTSVFWFCYACFDLRHTMDNASYHYQMSLWERIPFGCLSLVCGIYLVVRGIREIREWAGSNSRGER